MRKKSLTRQVRRAYRQDELARVCMLREDRFGRAFGMDTVRIPTGRKSCLSYDSGLPEDYYHFKDNNSSVLAVAHLDTVVSQKGRTPHFRATERGPLITSGALDDRLGAYVITHLLPKLGITCDWLLTVGEESGASTAEHFDAGGKKYDWVIEFDRGGTDVVMYQYEDPDSVQLVEAAGADVDWGSFSDIAYLEHLDVKAFNWGVGYRGNYHSAAGYAYLNDTFAMVAKYLRFHEQNAGTRLPHEPRPKLASGSGTKYSSGSYRSAYDKYDDDKYGKHDEYYRCDSCGEKAVDSVTWYCTFCGICADCGATDPDIAAEWNDPDADVCQCYAPEKRGTGDPDDRDWRAMDWDEYLKQRPASPDDAALKDAHAEAQAKDGPGTLISAAPPWSEHRPSFGNFTYGLGVPTSRNKPSFPGTGSGSLRKSVEPWNPELRDAPADYGTRLREEKDRMTARFQAASDQAHSAINPPAVFPDADEGWHEATTTGIFVVSHKPGQAWAQVCLRCAARWPHPVSGSVKIHPEVDCPGCDRCGHTIMTSGAIHVIPAHLAGESDLCDKCRTLDAAAAETERSGDEPSQRDDYQPPMSPAESARLTETDR